MVIEIEKQGSYLPMSSDSFFLNTLSVSNIQHSWSLPTELVVNSYLSVIGRANLFGIYLRGSVAKGTAIDHLSDIDSFALLNTSKCIDPSVFRAADEAIVVQSPFVRNIERICIFKDCLLTDKSYGWWRFTLSTESVCLWGKDITQSLPRFQPDQGFYESISSDLGCAIYKVRSRFVFSSLSPESVSLHCEFIMKHILRQAMHICVVRSGLYSRDLYLCYELFSRFYPERQSQMYEALFYSINPSSDIFLVERILSDLGDWLVDESLRFFST